jgi:hypothetical protein
MVRKVVLAKQQAFLSKARPLWGQFQAWACELVD